jgi:SPP1 gp7 family putative phage head morphogenesis protein
MPTSFTKPTDFPWSPTGTTGLQKAFALAIRKVFRDRLREIYGYIARREARLTESLRLKSAIDPVTTAGITTILERLKLDLSPIVTSYVGASFWKANEMSAQQMGFKGWIPFDMRVLKAIQDESYSFVNKFITEKHTELKDILSEGISQGDTISTISKEIKDSFKVTSYKSELIARSEVIKTYGRSTKMAIINGGVTDKYQWKTSRKENVCPQCRPLHNRVFSVHDSTAPMPVVSTHPQCLVDPQVPIVSLEGHKRICDIKIGDLVLTAEGKFRKVLKTFRGHHTGGLITIKFSKYEKDNGHLTVTPEHPILTKNGYVKALYLTEKDEIAVLAKDCKGCGVLIPDLIGFPKYCCKKCGDVKTAKEQWKTMRKEMLECTKNNGGWNKCKSGDYRFIYITPRKISFSGNKKVRTYNLEVEEFNNYIAKGVVIHNCNCGIVPKVEI